MLWHALVQLLHSQRGYWHWRSTRTLGLLGRYWLRTLGHLAPCVKDLNKIKSKCAMFVDDVGTKTGVCVSICIACDNSLHLLFCRTIPGDSECLMSFSKRRHRHRHKHTPNGMCDVCYACMWITEFVCTQKHLHIQMNIHQSDRERRRQKIHRGILCCPRLCGSACRRSCWHAPQTFPYSVMLRTIPSATMFSWDLLLGLRHYPCCPVLWACSRRGSAIRGVER